MHPFHYQRAADPAAAIAIAGQQPGGPPTGARIQYLAGGTTMLDLMKLQVVTPRHVVDRKWSLGRLASRPNIVRNEPG